MAKGAGKSVTTHAAGRPLFVCNIAWMSRYDGQYGKPDKPVGGGGYVNTHGKAGEVCNFVRCAGGHIYGHVETIKGKNDRTIGIEALGAKPKDFKVDGVDVVWVATNPDEGGRRVVGWYRDATVYRERQYFDDFPSKQHGLDEVDNYRIWARAKNAVLLPLDARGAKRLHLGNGKEWIGEVNWWYPETKTDPEVRKFVRSLREFIDAGAFAAPPAAPGKRRGRGKWGAGADPERKAEVEDAAIKKVKSHYCGCDIKDVTKDNVGWDLEAMSKDSPVPICLEVKGLFGSELKVGITPNEYKALRQHMEGKKPGYRLCVVTGALSKRSRLRILRFDHGNHEWTDEKSRSTCAIDLAEMTAAIVSLAAGNSP